MHNYGHWKKTLALLVMSALSLGASSVDAMPEGGVIRSGEGAVTQNGKEMTIRQDSGRLAMDWTNFNVGKDETVRFQQPGKDALALNRVTGNQQSLIDGSLLSNGHVLLVNPNGVVIGKNASIDVGGLVASTAQVKDNFMKEFGNSTGTFTLGGVSDGKIINEGTINAEGGLVALHAAKVENSGTITSNGGSVLMAAADTLTLTPDTDGKLNFTVDGKVAEASALNKGAITADGGTIVMTADSASDVMSTVVNNEGTLQARTLRKNEKGQILLEGNDKGQVEVSGTLDASGTENGQDAGNIKVIGQKTIVHDGTNLLAKGDVNGGKIETSGDVLDLGDNLNIDAKGVNGKAGEWLLDPLDVIIADSDPTGTSNYDGAEKKEASDSDFLTSTGTNTRTDLIGYNDPTATSSNAQDVFNAVTWVPTSIVKTMLEAGTNVRIQAVANNGSANIIVKNNIEKTSGGGATLTLEAMRNITINGNITATGENNKLNVILNADTNGDATGAVIINADIKTNGGDFTSASGGKVTYTGNTTAGYGNGKLEGKADSTGHTVGTYFGHVDGSGTADGAYDNRLIQTHGGKITLNGEVAIGLNGGTLTLDSNGGKVNVTGIINSGNSYGAYVYGTTTWNELTQTKVDEYLANGNIPAYHYRGVNYQRKRVVKTDENGNPVTDADGNLVYATDANGNPIYEKDANGNYVYLTDDNGNYIVSKEKEYYTGSETHYTFTEQDSENVRWPSDGTSTSVSTGAGYGYSSVIVSKGSMTTQEYLQYLAVSDPDSFLAKYMVSGATISIGGTNYTLARGTKSGVNYLGYKQGNNVVQLTTTQLQNLAYDAATRALNKDDTTTMKNGSSAYTNLVDNIRRLLASNWFEAKDLAQGSTRGGSAVNDSYLATITTILENSLTTPNGQQILWAGGMGSGVRNKKGTTTTDKQDPYSWYGLPDDPTHQNGMYWVTGPEGKVTNSDGAKGTQFYSNVGSDWNASTPNYGETVYGYANWDTYKSGGKIRYQPDNSAPFLTVGYGTTGKWDDAAFGGDTTIGFVKETNLANSSLNIKAGSGEVKLQGDIGKSKALDTVNIESIGAVKVGDTSNTATEYHNGTIYADHGVYINGSDVTVGGEIHSGGSSIEATRNTTWVGTDADKMDNVTINASRNLTVHGIESNGYTTSSTDAEGNTTSTTAGGKIKLVSTATATGTEGVGVITLGDGVDYNGKNTNGGVLKAASTANDSVVIDAQGAESKFKNETSSTKAIDTQGKWKIYSASPEQNTFGKNLNSVTDDSVTDAQWTSNSTKFTAADSDENKYIFQTTPTITLYVEDHEKTYGDDITKELQSYLKSREEFTGLDGKLHNVNEFTDAFTEKTYDNYISGAEKVTVTSVGKDGADGAVGTATRTGGTHAATEKSGADGKNAVYDLNVNLNGATAKNGYVLKNENATLEILKRKASITGKGTQTYGDTDGTIKKWQQDTQTNIANGSKVTYDTSVKPGSAYTDNQKGRNTADFGTYENSVSFDNLKITDVKGNEVNIAANYDLTTTGTIDVAKAKLNINIDDTSATYGSSEWTPYTYKLDKLVNGDTSASITVGDWQNGGIKTDSTDKNVKTQNVGGSYKLTGKFELTGDTAKNYEIGTVNPGKAIVNPKDINIYAEGNGSTLSDVTWTKIEKDKLVNGDSWDNFTFRVEPGDLISYADKTFGIKGYVNGQPVSDGTQIGNYIYHPTGIVQLTFNPIVKPDVWAHSGGYRPRNKIETSLPVFRVEDAKVGQYGTYGVEHREDEDKLVLSATGMRLPEPDQVPDEERTFTTTLSTEEGSGTFKLEYNGVSLKVHPQDKKAEEVVRAGDKTKNVSLSEKALYVGYTEMGLDLIDLKGVYIYFN
ncbi:filamentous hemagglutinin N-terminal domain-containing protein [uncultured Dialister sp.]|jgi:filamentous hemagglutinin family protein|uniref:two-partner secretion domain-containing protein n=1 Tax=uncultured Dialister sp. TaxID=278064 RepID=UPI0025FCD726|nr:filamentous hemagglutinin N-terminal domain-containing protein [uncultured Dialister sp.]